MPRWFGRKEAQKSQQRKAPLCSPAGPSLVDVPRHSRKQRLQPA
jgi:hypothetical protein